MTQGAAPEGTVRPAGAVFLSYASEDAPAAQRICGGLRASGIEVWFDQSELRGGDAWDQSIRRQIKSCALFMPIVSRATHARDEGYFRLEWKLAIDRSHLIMSGKPFLVPISIDETPQDDDHVPERFREVQWTRLPGGEPTPEFVARLRRLLIPAAASAPQEMSGADAAGNFAAGSGAAPAATTTTAGAFGAATGGLAKSAAAARPPLALWMIAAALAVGCAYLLASKLWPSKATGPDASITTQGSSAAGAASPAAGGASAPTGAFDPPAHSIAVLPFVNLSGDPKQEYFSDGLTEELLNSLAEIQGLQVAARTSAFSFKGQDTDIGTIARKLNVATVLEGSVRRSEHTVRITAQLINAQTGFHLWSKTYDRDLGDVLKLQTEIATAVANALQVTLLGDVGAKIEVGGTRNPAALDAYLRAQQVSITGAHTAKSMLATIDAYSEAIRLDPNFAMALARRGQAYIALATEFLSGVEARAIREKSRADVDRALQIAPDLADTHVSLANLYETSSQYRKASEEFARALALSPGDARVLRYAGIFDTSMGNFDGGIASLRRALVLDPLNPRMPSVLGQGLFAARRYDEAIAVLKPHLSAHPDDGDTAGNLGQAYFMKGDLESARKTCESVPEFWFTHWCLATVYDKLGRRADADRMLAKMKAVYGDGASYQYATIYAQRGDTAAALDWLDTALKAGDPGIEYLKTDPLVDPLRKEPRFQAIEKKLDFPQ